MEIRVHFFLFLMMLLQLLNWRSFLALIAIAIVSATIFFSDFLSKKIAREEKQKIEQWVEAVKEVSSEGSNQTNLTGKILTENSRDIPMIAVTEKDSILDHYNIDTLKIAANNNYLQQKLAEFKGQNEPIVWQNPLDPTQNNKVYYGKSALLKQIQYFPLIQLMVGALFILITLLAVGSRNKSTQNQVWAGMAKETAHQLGTPLSSLQGWVEILKETGKNENIVQEMSKDVDRLKLVSDRFGKIGSTPQLELTNLVPLVTNMVDYIKRRAPEKVLFSVHSPNGDQIMARLNAPLFDWVIENLLKNALDAMEGKGDITLQIRDEAHQVTIDVSDSGKGISAKNLSQVFKPGFTTKKRGWGLGLSLSKRIIEQYHKGHLFVKQSEPGKGTTFRVILMK